jgi:hypothetical protein
MDINGKALIGASIEYVLQCRFFKYSLTDALYSWFPRNLAVICIDFRDRAHISITHFVSPATTDTYSDPTGFFIDPRDTGFVDRANLVFWCMDPDVAVQTASLELTVRSFPSKLTYRSSPSVDLQLTE